MKKKLLLLLFLATALFSTGCVPRTYQNTISQQNTLPSRQPNTNPQVRNSPLPTFSYQRFQTVQGPILTIGSNRTGFLFPEFKGKIILLEVFGQDCHFCIESLPSISSLHAKYRQNLQVVALQVQEPMSRGKVNSLIQQFNMNYPIIDRESASELMSVLKSNYEWMGALPFTLLIKNGVTEQVFTEKTSKEEIERAIQKLL